MTPSPMPRQGGDPPRPPRQPVFNAPPGVMWTTAVLVVCHALFNILPATWRYGLLEWFAFVPAYFWAQFQGDAQLDLLSTFSLITHAFLHADLLHLFLNGGLLLAFGSLIERAMGTSWFLLLFALAAAGGALAQALAVGPALVVMIGASGAVYGMIGAAIPFLFAGRVGQSRRSALTFIVVIMGLNLVFGAFGLGEMLSGGGAIAWQAHIGGFLVGLLLGVIRRGSHGHA